MKKLLVLIIIVVLAGTGWLVWQRTNEDNKATSTRTSGKSETPFDKTLYSIDEADSIWVVVNKRRALEPTTYRPANLVIPNVALQDPRESQEMQLRADAATALEKLVDAAKQEAGYSFMLASGYRSASFQEALYNRYVRQEGQASADQQSARPGHSEHQTGLAADIATTDGVCVIEDCFGDMSAGKWVAGNAHRFGFIIRYQKDKTDITGYMYEPWHLRYVGDALATEAYKQKVTLEEFFDLPAAPDYQ